MSKVSRLKVIGTGHMTVYELPDHQDHFVVTSGRADNDLNWGYLVNKLIYIIIMIFFLEFLLIYVFIPGLSMPS